MPLSPSRKSDFGLSTIGPHGALFICALPECYFQQTWIPLGKKAGRVGTTEDCF